MSPLYGTRSVSTMCTAEILLVLMLELISGLVLISNLNPEMLVFFDYGSFYHTGPIQ